MTVYTDYHCARCGRRLKRERYIFSAWTKLRYCWVTECRAEKKRRSA